MPLSEPKKITFYIALILVIIGLIFALIPTVSGFAIWLVLIGFIVLALGNILKGW